MKRNEEQLDNEHSHLMLSWELLAFLVWATRHGKNHLNALIGHAYKAGLEHDIHKIKHLAHTYDGMEAMQDQIVHFFDLLEEILSEARATNLRKRTQNTQLGVIAEHVDHTMCDEETIRTSLEQAASHACKNSSAGTAKQLLAREILKRWKPQTNKKNGH